MVQITDQRRHPEALRFHEQGEGSGVQEISSRLNREASIEARP